ncbi:hypothetical protein M885DRAFT_85991 [Pelagophyceae sp. CCMP2097]|nr:hypothetical protein M885DRAFT_85991 [Pelagophyceae sp. CCMP2097]
MSACWTKQTAIAKRCSSPPDKRSMGRSWTCSRSKMRIIDFALSRWHFWLMMSTTVPFTARGMWSTYCGLMMASKLSSRMRVK